MRVPVGRSDQQNLFTGRPGSCGRPLLAAYWRNFSYRADLPTRW